MRVDIEAGLSSRGALDTRQGLADIGMLTRILKPDETGLVSHPLGRDALAFIVHRENTIPSLTESQLVGLFARSYTTWRELGGMERPILLMGLSDGRAARGYFHDFLGLDAGKAKPDTAVATSEQVVRAVACAPGGVGYLSLASARLALSEQPVRILPLAGVFPNPETISMSKYPFVRPCILVTRPESSDLVRRFVAFALASEQYDILREHFLAPP